MNRKKLKLVISNAEQYLKNHLDLVDGFDYQFGHLPIFDMRNTNILVENKFWTDGISANMTQIEDELTRSNELDTFQLERHCIWLWNLKACKEDLRKRAGHLTPFEQARTPTEIYVFQYKRFVSLCCAADVYPHMVEDHTQYKLKLVDIFYARKYEHPLQIHKKPSLTLNFLAKVISLQRGITERDAWEISELELDEDLFPKINEIVGVKVNGKLKKVAIDLYRKFAKLSEFYYILLESDITWGIVPISELHA